MAEPNAPILFTGVRIFDGTGRLPVPGEVRVEGERIAAVSLAEGPLSRDGAQVVDCGGGVLMPGLVEAHAHLSFPTSVEQRYETMMLPVEEHVLATARNARILLDHGFTSAYSAGANRPGLEPPIKREIEAGQIPGPRLRASSVERAPEFTYGPHAGRMTREKRDHGVEQVKAFIRDQAEAGCDTIKLLLSGDEGFKPGGSHELTHSEEEVAAAAEQAEASGVWLACHAQATEAIRRAIRYRFRILYHCLHSTPETMDMMEADRDRLFVAPAPGLLWSRAYEAEWFGIDRAMAEKMGAFSGLERMQEIYPELKKRGLRILPGGDYGFPYNPIGRNARDLELFVDLFGFTPAEALRAATEWGGQLMGLEVGLVKAGYLADLILVDGDPMEDIRVLQDKGRLNAIMKGGAFHKAPGPLH